MGFVPLAAVVVMVDSRGMTGEGEGRLDVEVMRVGSRNAACERRVVVPLMVCCCGSNRRYWRVQYVGCTVVVYLGVQSRT